MSNGDEMAFPQGAGWTPSDPAWPGRGLTKRELFAAMIAAGIVAAYAHPDSIDPTATTDENMAAESRDAVRRADALLAALRDTPPATIPTPDPGADL